jgi:hypothetical protein
MTRMRHRHALHPTVLILAALALASCSKPVDLPKVLEVVEVSTGYFDAGIVDGQTKIVPTIALRLKNRSNEPVDTVQVIAKFNVINDPEELGSAPFVRAIGSDGLASGQTTSLIVMKTNLGYTSPVPRAMMFTHSQFKDVKVEVFGKYRSQQFQKLGEYTVSRTLLTR